MPMNMPMNMNMYYHQMEMSHKNIEQSFEYYSNLLYGVYDFSGSKINNFSQYELDYNDDRYIYDYDTNSHSLSNDDSTAPENDNNKPSKEYTDHSSYPQKLPDSSLDGKSNTMVSTGMEEPSSSMTLVNHKNTSMSSMDVCSSSMTSSKMKTSKSILTRNNSLLSSATTVLPSSCTSTCKLPSSIIMRILAYLYHDHHHEVYEVSDPHQKVSVNPNRDIYSALFVCKNWYSLAKKILWIKPKFPTVKSYKKFIDALDELPANIEMMEVDSKEDSSPRTLIDELKVEKSENDKESSSSTENDKKSDTNEVKKEENKIEESPENNKKRGNSEDESNSEEEEQPLKKKVKIEMSEETKSEKMDIDATTTPSRNQSLGSLVQYLYIGDNRYEINGSEETIEIPLPLDKEKESPSKEPQVLLFKHINDNRGGSGSECHQFIKSKIVDEHVRAIAEHCPNLKHISLTQCQRVTDESLEYLISKCPNLEHVTLAGCNITDKTIINLSKLTKLTKINIQRSNVSESALQILVRCCPKLESINLSECNNVSDILVSDICHYCPEVRYLGLSKCYKITEAALYEIKNKLKKIIALDFLYF